MSREHLANRDAFRILPPSPLAEPAKCVTWPECGCPEGECEKKRRAHVERLLRQPLIGPVETILLAAIVALAAFAIFGV